MLRIATGVFLIIAGTTWTLQGLDAVIAPESFMTGDRIWVWLGAISAVSGVVLVWWGIRARRHDS